MQKNEYFHKDSALPILEVELALSESKKQFKEDEKIFSDKECSRNFPDNLVINEMQNELDAEEFQNEMYAMEYQSALFQLESFFGGGNIDKKIVVLDTYVFGKNRGEAVVIVDTNSWFTNESRDSLKKLFFLRGVEVFIPGVIVKEMDHLSKKKDFDQVAKNHMREVLKLIHLFILEKGHAKIGDLEIENQYKGSVPNISNDDVINWYVGKFAKARERLVCLVSKDINLRILSFSFLQTKNLVFFDDIQSFVRAFQFFSKLV